MNEHKSNGRNNLFAYGTLMSHGFVKRLISRLPDMEPGTVKGFKKYYDSDIGYYSATKENGCEIHGIILEGVSDDEMRSFDEYEEVSRGLYKRIRVTATSADTDKKMDAYMYVSVKSDQ